MHQSLHLISSPPPHSPRGKILTQALHSVLGPIGPLLHSGVSVAPHPRHFVVGFAFSPVDSLLPCARGDVICLPSSGALDPAGELSPAIIWLPSAANWMRESKG